MLDRLISGAGAVAHLADRIVRVVVPGNRADYRPVGLALAGLLGVVALIGVVLGAENLGDRTVRELGANDVAEGNHGNRAYATVTGGLIGAYVETFRDDNDDGQQQPEEKSVAWIYFLVDPTTKRGVTVESERNPAAVYAYRATGVVVDDADYVREDADLFKSTIDELGITLDARSYIDTTKSGQAKPVALADELPAEGTAVDVEGSRSVDFLDVCSTDPNNDGDCTHDEADLWDVLIYDPVSQKAVTVLTATSPEFAPATFTGMLRRAPNRVAEAQVVQNEPIRLSDYGVTVSPDYLLSDGDRPADPGLLFALAIVAGAVAAVIAVGLAGGYVRFRPGGALPPAASELPAGGRIPLRITGDLRTPKGFGHVREAPADLVRFAMVPVEAEQPEQSELPPVPAAPEVPPTTPASEPVSTTLAPEPPPATAGPDQPPTTPGSAQPPTTLIIERGGRPEGIAVGRGELTAMEAGTVYPFRGARPALRLTAGTGTVLVSFDSSTARDVAAAELAAETGIGEGRR
jgi:hypothetical protein